jgi:hypothetical protein
MSEAHFLREQAEKCRRLADGVATNDVREALLEMAADYEARADETNARERGGRQG